MLQSLKPSGKPIHFNTQQVGGVLTFPPAVPSVGPSGDSISLPSYVSSVKLSRAPSEQTVRALQEERMTALEKVKSLEKKLHQEKLKEMKLFSYGSYTLSN